MLLKINKKTTSNLAGDFITAKLEASEWTEGSNFRNEKFTQSVYFSGRLLNYNEAVGNTISSVNTVCVTFQSCF